MYKLHSYNVQKPLVGKAGQFVAEARWYLVVSGHIHNYYTKVTAPNTEAVFSINPEHIWHGIYVSLSCKYK